MPAATSVSLRSTLRHLPFTPAPFPLPAPLAFVQRYVRTRNSQRLAIDAISFHSILSAATREHHYVCCRTAAAAAAAAGTTLTWTCAPSHAARCLVPPSRGSTPQQRRTSCPSFLWTGSEGGRHAAIPAPPACCTNNAREPKRALKELRRNKIPR